MKRTIHITESQLNAIVKKINEVTISGDENLATSPTVDDAARKTLTGAKKEMGLSSNSPVTVGFSDDALNKKGITEKKSITKREIKEARLNKLVRESIGVIKKKNFK